MKVGSGKFSVEVQYVHTGGLTAPVKVESYRWTQTFKEEYTR